MAGPIKCTYEDCFRRFETVEAMRKHKAKDAAHRDFYCKRCDEDCTDDTEYLIHQLSSPKHIACPLCGIEFKSEGGRERHVGIQHKAKQFIKCVGCGQIFDSASRMMAHIEDNKCRGITKNDFHRHKAEQQLEQDAQEGMEGGLYQGFATVSGHGSKLSRDPNLLEDQRVPRDRVLDQETAVAEDFQRAGHGSSIGSVGMLGTITEGVTKLGMDEYPPLRAATSTNLSSTRKVASDPASDNTENSDLLDMKKEAEQRPSELAPAIQNDQDDPDKFKAAIPWNNFAQRPALTNSKSSGVNQLDFDSTVDGTTFDTKTSVATRGTRTGQYNQSTIQNNLIPPAAQPENQDPNAPHAHLQTQVRLQMSSQLNLQTYWDPIQQCYICPGMKCSRRLKSVKEFQEHLLSDAHSGGTVQCPSCFKRFQTTTALVAHAESGSTKCDLRNSTEFDLVMRSITAGLIKVDGTWSDGSHKYSAVPVDQW